MGLPESPGTSVAIELRLGIYIHYGLWDLTPYNKKVPGPSGALMKSAGEFPGASSETAGVDGRLIAVDLGAGDDSTFKYTASSYFGAEST